jgi:hypothetical protein
MRNFISLCTSLFMMVFVFASPVRAQNTLWVANNGDDTNACTEIAPCATFQGAINKGSVSQIGCLTSGRYGGSVTITASIIIDCGMGNVGHITVSGNAAEAVNIVVTSPVTVVLRHLSLNGLGTGQAGISASMSGSLTVEDCTIFGFGNGDGISFGAVAGRSLLQVTNSQIMNNSAGIVVFSPTSTISSVILNRVEVSGNATNGLSLTGQAVVAGTMRDSVVAANGTTGVMATAGQVYFTVEETSIVDNLTNGIQTNSAGALLNVGASTIGGNGTGVLAQQGSIISFGNNQMSTNGTNGNFSSTTALR